MCKRTDECCGARHARHRRELPHFGAELQQKAEAREERDGAKEGAAVEERAGECPEGPRAGVLEGGRGVREDEPAREKEEGGEGLADDEGVMGGDKRLHGSLQGDTHYAAPTKHSYGQRAGARVGLRQCDGAGVRSGGTWI